MNKLRLTSLADFYLFLVFQGKFIGTLICTYFTNNVRLLKKGRYKKLLTGLAALVEIIEYI